MRTFHTYSKFGIRVTHGTRMREAPQVQTKESESNIDSHYFAFRVSPISCICLYRRKAKPVTASTMANATSYPFGTPEKASGTRRAVILLRVRIRQIVQRLRANLRPDRGQLG